MNASAIRPSPCENDCGWASGSVPCGRKRPRRRATSQVATLASVLAAVDSPSPAAGRIVDTLIPVSAQSRQSARLTACRQVHAAVSALAADAGTATWLCIRATDQEPPLLGSTDLVGCPLLSRSAPVRVLVCAPDTGRARALFGPLHAVLADSLRVTRYEAGPGAAHLDVLTAPGSDTVMVVPGPDGVLRVGDLTGPAVNTLIRALVDSLWDAALPLDSAERLEEVTRDPIKLKILGWLQSGAKDETIAREVGMSLRTCRRHIGELLTAADAVSRFQAASRLARAGVLGAVRLASIHR